MSQEQQSPREHLNAAAALSANGDHDDRQLTILNSRNERNKTPWNCTKAHSRNREINAACVWVESAARAQVVQLLCTQWVSCARKKMGTRRALFPAATLVYWIIGGESWSLIVKSDLSVSMSAPSYFCLFCPTGLISRLDWFICQLESAQGKKVICRVDIRWIIGSLWCLFFNSLS